MDVIRRFVAIGTGAAIIWFAAVMVRVAGASSGMQDFIFMLAFLGTLAIGIVAGLEEINRHASAQSATLPAAEKAKREAPAQDARLALLLELLSPAERDALKQRLLDELSADGEAVPLADLLAEQDAQERRARP
jgi:hypothetical protein